MHYSIFLISYSGATDPEAYLTSKFMLLPGNSEQSNSMADTDELAEEDAQAEDMSSIIPFSAYQKPAEDTAALLNKAQAELDDLLRGLTEKNGFYEPEEHTIETRTGVYAGDSPDIFPSAPTAYIKTNLAEFLLINSTYGLPSPTHTPSTLAVTDATPVTAGPVMQVTLALLKSLGAKVGSHLGEKLLEELGLKGKQLSLTELRDQLKEDIKAANIEQTLNEQRALVFSAMWDFTNKYPHLDDTDQRLTLTSISERLSSALSILTTKDYCFVGAPEFALCAATFLLTIHEYAKRNKVDIHKYEPYASALERVLEPVGLIKGHQIFKRREQIGLMEHQIAYRKTGKLIKKYIVYFRWWDAATGTWTRASERKYKEPVSDWEARAKAEHNAYIRDAWIKAGWMQEYQTAWQAELALCKKIGN